MTTLMLLTMLINAEPEVPEPFRGAIELTAELVEDGLDDLGIWASDIEEWLTTPRRPVPLIVPVKP